MGGKSYCALLSVDGDITSYSDGENCYSLEEVEDLLNELDKEIRDLKLHNNELVSVFVNVKLDNDFLTEENEQLRHDASVSLYCNHDYRKENEQLKQEVDYWKQVASQYSNELNVFEHCKKHKTECKDIYWSSD